MKRYIKTEWIDNRTPVNAKNLNKIEDALETLSIDSLDISKIQGVNGIKVVTKDDGGVEISGNIQVVPEVEGQSYDTGKVYFVLDPSSQKVKGLVVAGEFTKLGDDSSGDGTGDSPLGRVTFRVTILEDTLGTLETRIGDLESRPVSKAVDLEPVNTKIAGLENRLGTLESRPVTDNSLGERVASLENAKSVLESKDSVLEGRVQALESKPGPDFGPLDTKVAGLETRVQTLEEKSIPDVRPIITKNENLESRIGALESKTGPNLEPLETRLSVLERREIPNIQPLETRVQNLESRPVPENLDTLKSRVSVLEAKETPSLEPVNTKISGIDERIKVLESRPSVDLNPLTERVQTLEGKTIPDISPLTQRVEVLERKETPDLGPLTNRIKALEDKTIPDVEPIKSRLDVLEGKEIPDIRPVTERVGALERRVIPDLGPLTERVGALETEKSSVSGRLSALESRPVPESLESIKSRLGALESRPIATEKGEVDLSPITSRITALEEAPKPVDYSKDIEGVKGKIGGLESRIGTLETRPGPDLGPIENRISVLEAKPSVDLGPLTGRVDTLERREIPNIGPLENRVAALENKPEVNLEPLNTKIGGIDERVKVIEGKTIPDLGPVNSKITALEESKTGIETRLGVLEGKTIPDIAPLTSRIETLEGREIPSLDPVNTRIQGIDSRVAELEKIPDPSGKIGGLETRIQTLEGKETPNLQPIETRLSALESKPEPDFGPVNSKITGLTGRVETLEGKIIPDIQPLTQRISTLEESKTSLSERIQTLENKPENTVDLGPVNTKITGLTGRVETLESKPVVNLTPLTERVTALENRPAGVVTGAFPRGNYDRSRYNRTVTEEEVEKMLRDGTAPNHQDGEGNADDIQEQLNASVQLPRLPEHIRAACCVYECPTAEKVVLRGGIEFVRISNKEDSLEVFCNTSTSELFAFYDTNLSESNKYNKYISVYPYNKITEKIKFDPRNPLVTSVVKFGYEIYRFNDYYKTHDNILDILRSSDPVKELRNTYLSRGTVRSLGDYNNISDSKIVDKFGNFLVEVTNENSKKYFRLSEKEKEEIFPGESCTVFKNIGDGTFYKLGKESRLYDASEVELPNQGAKYVKGEVLARIPGIPGTYTIREDFYADLREISSDIGFIRVLPTNPKPLEPVADQIKKLLALSQNNSTESVNLQPLTDRVAALENAPKPEDKSQEITTLQGTVAEHTTSIASNTQRITVLEGKADILGENGKIKSNLLPENQALPSDLVRTSDLEDVVRKSALFDTEHNMILPELIPEAEVAVKWLKGKGRPDKPETTEGVIVGNEANLTRYVSTDGAGTGAWEWEKRNGSWHVVRGDTGWRKLTSGALADGNFILIRRNEVQVDVQFYSNGAWGIIKFKPMSQASKQNSTTFKLYEIQEGFRGCMAVICPLYDDDTLTQIGGINFNTQISGGGHIMTARFASNIDKEHVPGVRPGLFNFPTVDPWPSSLPGESFEASCPST